MASNPITESLSITINDAQKMSQLDLIADYLSSNPEAVDKNSVLLNVLNDAFPSDGPQKCELEAVILSKLVKELQAVPHFSAQIAREYACQLEEKRSLSSGKALRAILQWALILNKCSKKEVLAWSASGASGANMLGAQALESVVPETQPLHCSNEAYRQAEPGDIITFGRYPQNKEKVPEPIEWLVLQRSSDTLLVTSKYALESRRYNSLWHVLHPWQRCELRSWLNDKFFQTAFNTHEQAMIAISEVESEVVLGQWLWGHRSATTEDYLFIFSEQENQDNFDNDDQRKTEGTPVALKHRSLFGRLFNQRFIITRSTSWTNSKGLFAVDVYGSIIFPVGVANKSNLIRPVMRLLISD